MVEKREGIKFIAHFDIDEPVVSMCQFKDTVYVATSRRVFYVEDGVLKPLEIRYKGEICR